MQSCPTASNDFTTSPPIAVSPARGAAGIHADAGRGLGQVQMPRLVSRLLDKAASCGVAAGALRNCGHVGRLGEWVELIAGKGYAGFVAVNDNGALRIVAPPGGREGRTAEPGLVALRGLVEGRRDVTVVHEHLGVADEAVG